MDPQRTELAALLRSWRDRASPEVAGIPSAGERRVPGLRREELASLADLSVDYLVRLEQGRAVNPSGQVLGALAGALQLSAPERDLLFQRAGIAPPAAGTVPRHVTPGVRRMLDRLADTPVAVFTAAWEAIRWNELWAALLGDPDAWQGRERNLIWRHFGDGSSRVHLEDAQLESFEREMVTDLRVAAGRYPDDHELVELIAALRVLSDRFALLWDRFEVAPRTSALKTIDHPHVGSITLDCDVLTVPGSDLRVVVYTAEPGTPAAAALDELRVASA